MSDLPSGTIALLFTDIEGSTRLLQALGDAYPDVLATTRRLQRSAFAAHGGHEVDTQGDSFFVAFERTSEAVAAAITAQRNLSSYRIPDPALPDAGFSSTPDGRREGAVRVRMAIHVGEPALGAEGYAGLDVHRGARICAVAHGGQILLSQTAADLVRNQLPRGVSLRDLGEHALRDLQRPEHLYQLSIAGLCVQFPPPRSLANLSNSLPVPPTPLVGRDEEVAALVALLCRDSVRLVTLTGPGGTGKTRLGLAAAGRLLSAFRDGVYFVDLAPVVDASLVALRIAQALGVRRAGAQTLEENLQSFLASRQVLLLLDNFEQILAASELVARLLAHCPSLTLLVTSRAALRLSAEYEVPVAPLALPKGGESVSADQLRSYSAASLFEQRAQATRPDFAISDENARTVAAICARLDGLPLAIELAAARLKLFSPAALLARLDHRFSVLTGGARDLPARQQTLRDTIAWSYDLLSPEEQQLFRRLAIFAGGATLDAIEAIGSEPGATLLELVASLVDKSLLQPDTAAGEPRYRLLETIQEYALEQLTLHGERAESQQLQATYFAELAEQAEETLMSPAERGPWFARLDAEPHNLRAAVRWAIERGDGELGMRLVGATWLWLRRELSGEGLRWAEELLTRSVHQRVSAARAKALFVAGELAWAEEDYERAEQRLAASVSLWRELGDRRWLALALAHLARATLTGSGASPAANLAAAERLGKEAVALARDLGDPWILAWPLIRLADISGRISDGSAAHALAEESALLARSLGDRWLLARPIYILGRTAFVRGDWAAARAHLEEALPARREAHDKLNVSYVLTLLGEIALRQGDAGRAVELVADGLRIAWEIGNHMTIAHDLSLLARLSENAVRRGEAIRLLAAAEQIRERWNAVLIPPSLEEHQRLLERLRPGPGASDSAAAWAEGQTMSVDAAVRAGLIAADALRSP